MQNAYLDKKKELSEDYTNTTTELNNVLAKIDFKDIDTVIESIPGFASNSDGDPNKKEFAFGLQKAGTLNGRYKVYKNPYQKSNLILMGYRGSQFLETGAVFAPYIPLIMTPLVYDPNTFTPRKGLMTRYAKKMIRPEFYGKIYVSGLNAI